MWERVRQASVVTHHGPTLPSEPVKSDCVLWTESGVRVPGVLAPKQGTSSVTRERRVRKTFSTKDYLWGRWVEVASYPKVLSVRRVPSSFTQSFVPPPSSQVRFVSPFEAIPLQ